jgi:16S rRNA (uracil1498-N3)-methyltransferase
MSRYQHPTYRLCVSSSLAAGLAVPLEAGQMNYLLNVLRMSAGDKVMLFNGRDGEWVAAVETPTRKTAVLRIESQMRPQPAPSRITYAFAPLKAARLDYVVQKAVEMGAARLEPVITARTQVSRLKPERLTANAMEAAEQCGILTLPESVEEAKLSTWFKALPHSTWLIFCDEEAQITNPLAALAVPRSTICEEGNAARITLLIGPEGGFTPEERAMLLTHPRLVRLSLGPRILRGDTAGVAAMALVQAVLGDFLEHDDF